MWNQNLELIILVDPFQPMVFYDSMITGVLKKNIGDSEYHEHDSSPPCPTYFEEFLSLLLRLIYFPLERQFAFLNPIHPGGFLSLLF